MTQSNDTLPLNELIAVLQSLCTERRTGTMFVHTDTNRSARVSIERGRIFFIAFGRYRGMDAVEEFKKMQYGRFSFAESIFNNAAEIPLPPTSRLLAQLRGAAAGDPRETFVMDGAADPFFVPLATAAVVSAPAPPLIFANMPLPGSPEDLNPTEEKLRIDGDRLYKIVNETLALSIGPVASMVCDDYREPLFNVATPSELRSLLAQIAAEAGEPNNSARFLARVLPLAGL